MNSDILSASPSEHRPNDPDRTQAVRIYLTVPVTRLLAHKGKKNRPAYRWLDHLEHDELEPLLDGLLFLAEETADLIKARHRQGYSNLRSQVERLQEQVKELDAQQKLALNSAR